MVRQKGFENSSLVRKSQGRKKTLALVVKILFTAVASTTKSTCICVIYEKAGPSFYRSFKFEVYMATLFVLLLPKQTFVWRR